jgi:hypothetical protein
MNDAQAKMQHKAREMIKLLNIYLNHFPKHEKYGLAQEMRRTAYEIYALITECRKRYYKKTSLTNLDIRHEQLRMFVQLAFEMGYFEFKDGKRTDKPESQARHRLNAISVLVNELGAMIGGWMRSVPA